MTKIVVDCGNCGPDFSSIRQMVLANFDAVVVQTHGLEDTLEVLSERDVALVTVNRKLDRDYSDGMNVIRAIKADAKFAGIPLMLITNYDEHQLAAEQLGAVRGFGKLTVRDAKTIELLRPYLGTPKAAHA